MESTSDADRKTDTRLHSERDARAGKRKPYRRPRLERYGDVRAITAAVGNMGTTGDGGGAPMHKTS